MEITLKSKRKLKLKVLTQDMKDELMDSLELVGSGEEKTIKSPNKTMPKFLRFGLDCDVTDEFLALCNAKHYLGAAFTARHQGAGERKHQEVMTAWLVLIHQVCKAFPQDSGVGCIGAGGLVSL